ncbi:regulatory particle non-ATPase [Ascosphaera acerosa]|nr:regulatory particle non-ATPase [Ascosphaera acerosa]
MAAAQLEGMVGEAREALHEHRFDIACKLLAALKKQLLLANALVPSATTPAELVPVARDALQVGALTAIRMQDADGFRRYYQQLQPFYDLERHQATANVTASQDEMDMETEGGEQSPAAAAVAAAATAAATQQQIDLNLPLRLETSERSKITGLYLLLLLSAGDNTMFHTVLEGLVVEAALLGKDVEDDPYIRYPVELERSLMEGSYDKVWRATKSERVPAEEFGLFSSILVGAIRNEIADCSERAYPSLPISSAKNLLFLDSEGAAIEFAQLRGWTLRDGRIYFPQPKDEAAQAASALSAAGNSEGDEKGGTWASGSIIANTLGYARQLETIV